MPNKKIIIEITVTETDELLNQIRDNGQLFEIISEVLEIERSQIAELENKEISKYD